jgi:hypothetical protein
MRKRKERKTRRNEKEESNANAAKEVLSYRRGWVSEGSFTPKPHLPSSHSSAYYILKSIMTTSPWSSSLNSTTERNIKRKWMWTSGHEFQ